MIKFILGFAIWATTQELGLRPLWMMLGFGISGIVLQVIYTHALNDYLVGEDSVLKYGARNLKELRSIIPIPRLVIFLDILAKAFGYAAFGGLMLWLGWV